MSYALDHCPNRKSRAVQGVTHEQISINYFAKSVGIGDNLVYLQ